MTAHALTSDLSYACSHKATATVKGTERLRVDDQSVVTHANMLAEARRCIELARTLDLPVAGIDLRRTPSGEWYCFEVNPSPAYSWFDLDCRIATAIARFLAG